MATVWVRIGFTETELDRLIEFDPNALSQELSFSCNRASGVWPKTTNFCCNKPSMFYFCIENISDVIKVIVVVSKVHNQFLSGHKSTASYVHSFSTQLASVDTRQQDQSHPLPPEDHNQMQHGLP
jgi:hypothetical protein